MTTAEAMAARCSGALALSRLLLPLLLLCAVFSSGARGSLSEERWVRPPPPPPLTLAATGCLHAAHCACLQGTCLCHTMLSFVQQYPSSRPAGRQLQVVGGWPAGDAER